MYNSIYFHTHYHTFLVRTFRFPMQQTLMFDKSFLPEFLHHVRVREVVHYVLEDRFVVGVTQGSEHQNNGHIRPDVRQLRADLTPRYLAVLIALT